MIRSIGTTGMAVLLVCAAQVFAQSTKPDMTVADLETIATRYVGAILPTGQDATTLRAEARRLTQKMTADHTWPDIDTASQARSAWPLRDHLDRALVLAKAAAAARRDGHPDPVCAAAANDALGYWIAHDFHNPNWWWNEIGVPQLTGEAALCLGPDLRPEIRDGVVRLMKRSVWTKWTGQNLVWGAGNQIVRGILTSSPDLISQAYVRMYQEVLITTREGIQPDYSFHQHGQQFYSGGYGLDFAQDVGRYISYAWGTGCQPPADTLDIYTHFLLDGEAWMTWGRLFDYSALGREITRKGKVAVPISWTGGPIVPIGRAYGLGQTVSLLAPLPLPRQREYQSFANRLRGDGSPLSALVGHKHFYCSDYTSHRRPTYFFSLKMFSTRLQNTELVNDEGKKSHHLGDGNTFLYRTGTEYSDIFPVWDWSKLPGTTAEQTDDLNRLLPGGNHARGKTSFVGGVSDGMYGASAMILQRGALSAKKTWFFFDDEIVCLGSSIRCDSDNAVVTCLEQNDLHGAVVRDPNGKWVFHNGVGYVLPGDQNLEIATGAQSGSWSELGTGSQAVETRNVFKLWIDHGHHPRDASYAYVILPAGVNAEQTAARSATPDFQVLAQSDEAHVVRCEKLDITSAVFFAPGKAADITVNRPCILMIRDKKLSICDPTNQAGTLHLTLHGVAHLITLPADTKAGSTITMDID